MELVRLFCSSTDIKPRVLLSRFFRYIGLYLEEISGTTQPSDVESIADIYVISCYLVEDLSCTLEISEEDKTIFICKDGWTLSDSVPYIIDYDSDEKDANFIDKLMEYLACILYKYNRMENLLIKSVSEPAIALKYIAQKYIEHQLLPSAIYTRCYHPYAELYQIAFNNYSAFINDLSSTDVPYKESDLLSYARTLAMFEFDSICRKNSYAYYYSPKELSENCDILLKKYPDNEEIRILQADIHFELNDSWAMAANEYGDTHLLHCAYANYKRGRILRKCVEDYVSTVHLEQLAIARKSDYYSAWYQIAMCMEAEGRYDKAVNALEEICKILDTRYQKHILAPFELEYLYKSVVKISQIKIWLDDYFAANIYKNAAKEIKSESFSKKYLCLIWPEAGNNSVLSNKICNILDYSLNNCYEEKIAYHQERSV